MATKKDLVEAYSFSRRRLITAFVSGAPGGREVEPSRPGRTIVGGIALAVLMIAGAAVLGILTDRDPGDWEKQGVVSEKETGADYVILTDKGPLRPLSNITSAMLLLGPDLQRTDVSRDVIAKEGRRGEPIGIFNAPETPPPAGELLPSGWTACTGGDIAAGTQLGVKVAVTKGQVAVPAPETGLVVRSGGKLYVIGESASDRAEPRAYYYEIRQADADPILRETVDNTSEANAMRVPRSWLNLFTPGAPLTLESLGLDRARLGQPPRAEPTNLPDDASVGDLVKVGEATYLVTDEAEAIELDPFSLNVYLGLDKPGFELQELTGSARPGTIRDTGDLAINWPTVTLEEAVPGEVCAVLDAVTDGAPGARIASAPDDSASAAEVSEGDIERFVESGRGAVVRVGDWDDEGSAPPVLVDDRGLAYPLIGDAPNQLGYDDVDPVVVPDTWVALFGDGVELSVDAARCPPTTIERKKPCAS